MTKRFDVTALDNSELRPWTIDKDLEQRVESAVMDLEATISTAYHLKNAGYRGCSVLDSPSKELLEFKKKTNSPDYLPLSTNKNFSTNSSPNDCNSSNSNSYNNSNRNSCNNSNSNSRLPSRGGISDNQDGSPTRYNSANSEEKRGTDGTYTNSPKSASLMISTAIDEDAAYIDRIRDQVYRECTPSRRQIMQPKSPVRGVTTKGNKAPAIMHMSSRVYQNKLNETDSSHK